MIDLEKQAKALEGQLREVTEDRVKLREVAVQIAKDLDDVNKKLRIRLIAQRISRETGEDVNVQTLGPDGVVTNEAVGTPGA